MTPASSRRSAPRHAPRPDRTLASLTPSPPAACRHRRSRTERLILVAVAALALGAARCARAADGDRAAERASMVAEQIAARGIHDERVLAAFRTVPRHRFVPEDERAHAYDDGPLPIGLGQTISQPYVVAAMTEALRLKEGERVFELGTGSGYQAAVASRLCARVYTVEIHPELAERARRVLASLRYDNVSVRAGDGFRGWPEAAPFDAMLITASVAELPRGLLAQLAPGGRAILPLGESGGLQDLVLVEKHPDGELVTRKLFPVRFVPSTGDK